MLSHTGEFANAWTPALSHALTNDSAFRNATRFFLKNGEHTWGICKDWIHTSTPDNNSYAPHNAWSNEAFEGEWEADKTISWLLPR
jgi:hypothetical protein